MNQVEQIKMLIDKYQLKEKTKKRRIIYQRHYLFYKLKKAGCTLQEIADIFDMNHATCLYGIRKHEMWCKTNDSIYLNIIGHLMHEMGDDEPYDDKIKVQVKKKGLLKKITITGVIDPVILNNLKEYMTINEFCENLNINVEKS